MGTELRRYRDLMAGGTTRGQVNGLIGSGGLVRADRGVYSLSAGAERIDTSDFIRALFLRLPPGAALGFQSAAAGYGFGTVPDAVHVVIPAGTVRPRIRGVRVHEAVVPIVDVDNRVGVPCVPAARCAVDLARTVRRMDALPILDAALRVQACTSADLAVEVLLHERLKGVRQARELIALADPRAECPQESQLRLVILDAGLPAPEPQVWVSDVDGTMLYRLDLAYREQRVGLEYDGVSHADRSRMRVDRERMNWLDDHHWTMRYFTDWDLYRRPSYIVAKVRSALLAAR